MFSVIMIYFVFVTVLGVFLLVILENNDTRGMIYSLKAQYGAEGALELALLRAKRYSFWQNYEVSPHKDNEFSRVLFRSPLEKTTYHAYKDILIGYSINATASGISSKTISAWNFDIIPLFSFDAWGTKKKVTQFVLNLFSPSIVWNVLCENNGISGTWNVQNAHTKWNLRLLDERGSVSFLQKNVWDFLRENESCYLILHNVSLSDGRYSINLPVSWEFLTKHENVIIATAKVGEYKQNIEFRLQVSQYLLPLRYSVFSD